MSNLGNFLSYMVERHEQQKDEDKQRARKFKSLVDYADTAGIMSKDKAMTMDVDSLEGAVQGFAAKKKFDEVAANLKKFQQENDDRAALAGFARDFSSGDTSALRGMTSVLNMPTSTEEAGNRIYSALSDFLTATQPNNRLSFALARNPGAPANPQFDNSLNALVRFGGVDPELTTGTFTVPGTGATFVTRGKQILPAGFVPQEGSDTNTPVPQHDEEGNLIGWTVTDIRGHATFHANKSNAKLPPAVDAATGKAIPGYYVLNGRVVDTRSAMQKAGILLNEDGSMGLTESGESSQIPTVTTRGQYDALKSGAQYYDDKGNLRKKK